MKSANLLQFSDIPQSLEALKECSPKEYFPQTTAH